MVAIGAAWRLVRDRFRAAGLDTPELDARLLAQSAFGLDAMALVRNERDPVPADQLILLGRHTERRLAGEPVSRIVGRRGFWGLDFGLNEATLDPRPETELLVEAAIDFLESRPGARFIDLGTGSGAIAISILASVPGATGVATDISERALEQAAENARRHGVLDRLQLIRSDWWAGLAPGEQFDLIVSNPPYIASESIPALAPEVRIFDPKAALDGGKDGLEAYRALLAEVPQRLKPGGLVLFEIGFDQGPAARSLLREAGLARIDILKDVAGLDRVVLASHS